MIDIVTSRNVNAFNKTASGLNLIQAQSHVRYLAISSLGWDAPIFDHQNQMETDDFDTEDTIYLIKRGPTDNNDIYGVQGVVRLNPTIKPYMLEEPCFTDTESNPDLERFIVSRDSLVKLKDVWEGSRIAFHPELDKETRREGIASLVLAKAEFMKNAGIKHFIGMMPTYFWNSVFKKTGWNVTPFGEQIKFKDGSEAQAACYWMSDNAYEQRKSDLEVKGSQLNVRGDFKASANHYQHLTTASLVYGNLSYNNIHDPSHLEY